MPSPLSTSPPDSPNSESATGFENPRAPNDRMRRRAVAILALGVCLGSGTCDLAGDSARSPLEQMLLSALGIQFFLGCAALAGAALTRAPTLTRLGLGPGRLPWSLVWVAALGTLGLSHGIDGALHFAGLHGESILAQLDANLAGVRGKTLLLAVFGLAVAPGICEELLCRGLLQRGLVRRYGAPVAIGVGALVFGAMHLEWIQGSAAILLGLYLGSIAQYADSIRPAIFCHCCNNMAALAIGVLQLGGEGSLASVTLGIVAAFAALGVLFVHRRMA